MKKTLPIALAIIILVSCAAFLPRIIANRQKGAQSDYSEQLAADLGDHTGAAGDSIEQQAGQLAGKDTEAETQGGAGTSTALQSHAQQSGPESATAIAQINAPESLFLHIGSPIALSNGQILPIDSGNPGFTPILHKGRTLVPLRFVSEFYNAEVSYDTETKSGIVNIAGRVAEFPIGSDYYTLDGERIALDAETLNIDGRIMLPLRVLCEQVLGLSVDYRSSVILIAETASLDDDIVKTVKSKIGAYVKVADLNALTKYFEQSLGTLYYDTPTAFTDGFGIDMAERPMEERLDDSSNFASAATGAAPIAPSGSAEPDAAPALSMAPQEMRDEASAIQPEPNDGGEAGYSTTNTQVVGVDEGDIIKTDGRYIYLYCYDSIRIVDTEGKMSLAARIETDGLNLVDIYIDNGRLITVSNEYGPTYRIMPEGGVKSDALWSNSVDIRVYDTSDMSDIKLLRTYSIEGDLMTTRKQDGYLYVLSMQYAWNSISIADPRPMAGEDGKLELLPVGDIMIAPGCPANSIITLSAINIFDAGEKVTSESMAINGYSNTQYMSNNAMYIATRDYIFNGEDNMSIAKFTLNGGKIGYAGSGNVRGSLNNQFSMDEYNGHLRVVTTHWDGMNKNNLFVLDGNMQVCGSVEGFAPDESIYSARFMGGRAYVVTFRQMDPLFVFDLSDPQNPKITGELKVPGFSTYLHPISENVILGIGRDVYDIYMKDRNGKEVVVGQNMGGIKLSLFDVSDMGKPREMDTLILGSSGYAELMDNHKAAMFKADDDLLAFCANFSDDAQGWDWWNGAVLISYADDTLTEVGRIESSPNSGIYYGYSFYGQRLVYIGNTLYYADNNLLRSFDIHTLEALQSFRLG